MAEVRFFLRPAKKDIAGAGLQVARFAQSNVKQKADVFAWRPFGVQRMPLHGPPFRQARCRNEKGRIVAAHGRIDRIGGEPIAVVFLQNAYVGATENVDSAIARTVGEASQAAAKSVSQPQQGALRQLAQRHRFAALPDYVPQGSSDLQHLKSIQKLSGGATCAAPNRSGTPKIVLLDDASPGQGD
jgi:hypothetical protein